MPGKCTFNNLWLQKEIYSSWLQRNENKFLARCLLCLKTFDISNMGEAALSSHMKGKKHCALLKSSVQSTDMKGFFKLPAETSSLEDSNSLTVTSKAVAMVNYTSGNQELTAEILWALKVINSHYSYHSCDQINLLMQRMFPDSIIVNKFTCGQRKCAYLCVFGIAPYFKSLLVKCIKEQEGFVLLFDESLNHKMQVKQMDYYGRMWVNDKVVSMYFHSEFLGHATADIMLEKSLTFLGMNGLGSGNILQLSMDGPNVNWKFHSLFEAQLKNDYNCALINVGSCGLHIVHGAFKTGADATGWAIDRILSNLYYHFKDTPARREDFKNVTNTDIFPLKFCSHRWLENVPVAQRALEIWPIIHEYVKAVNCGKIKDPKNKSYSVLMDACKDPLTSVKIACFQSVAKLINPFLTTYQTDKPMLPFLATDIFLLMKSLLARFIKTEIMEEMTTISKLLQLNLTDVINHRDYKKIDLGFTAEKMLSVLKTCKKISDKQLLEIKMECKMMLVKTTSKLLDKAPLKYSLVRDLACLDPKLMKNKDQCLAKMKRILHILVEAKRVNENICDDVLRQFQQLLEQIVLKPEFKEFDYLTTSIDSIFFEHLGKNNSYRDLWKVIKLLLLLSHGQASVERGFSVNKQLEVENLKEKSLIAQRLISDHIRSVGGVLNVEISKGLLISAAGARKQYMAYLEEQKNKSLNEQQMLKRKKITDEIDELKKKKRRLEMDSDELLKSADEFAEKAEATRNLTWISKSNSFRKTAKDKMIDAKSVEISLDKKLEELKKY